MAVILMHLEEVAQQAEMPDTIAGLMRLLFMTFAAVSNKILPVGMTTQQAKALVAEDPAYFNDISCEHIVKCVANLMLVGDFLFPKDKAARAVMGGSQCNRVSGDQRAPAMA